MRDLTIEFENLTHEELGWLTKLETKMKVIDGEMTGSGYHIETHTRDWGFEVGEK